MTARCRAIGLLTLATASVPFAAAAQVVTPPATSATSPATSAQPATPESGAPLASAAEGTTKTSSKANVTWGGYVEAFYQYNLNDPSNGITNYRGFDTRHNSFTLSNAVLDSQWALDRVTGRLALQFGHTPQTYYLAEPNLAGASGSGESNLNVWKFLQQANVSWHAPIGEQGLHLDAGLFLSPIGPEGMPVKDQWNWSRSNLFFGLPFYHTGARATYAFTKEIAVTAHVYNGWNTVTDNNRYKSVAASFQYNVPDKLTFQALYFGGNERPTGAPEGASWRHLFDTYLAVYPTDRLSFLIHGDAGFEKNKFGTSSWLAGALYARFKVASWLYLAARGDRFHERVPTGASAIFWPSKWVSSGTFTIDTRPAENISIRLEYRHDQADGPTYFRGQVATDATTNQFIPDATSQDTVTLGATTWF